MVISATCPTFAPENPAGLTPTIVTGTPSIGIAGQQSADLGELKLPILFGDDGNRSRTGLIIIR